MYEGKGTCRVRSYAEFWGGIWCVRCVNAEEISDAACSIGLDTFVLVEEDTGGNELFAHGGERRRVDTFCVLGGDISQLSGERLFRKLRGRVSRQRERKLGLMLIARTLSFFWIASLDKPRPVSFSLNDSFTGDAGALARCWGILATRRECG